LREFFFNWLGANDSAPAPTVSTEMDDSDDSAPADHAEAQFVTAPGGYRIRVPNGSETDQNIRDMLPSVRDSLAQLPPLPYVVTELLREINNTQSSASSLAKIASSDPSLAASLLRTVNSAAIGLSRKITSVSEAVSYLGFATVKSIVVRLRLRDVLKAQTPQARQDSQDIWVHSLAVSYAAECLAATAAGVDRGFVSTLGLLHDIGKLAVIAKLPEQADALRKSAADDPNEDPLAAERRILGVDHAHLGGELAAAWKLPADLVQAIHWHHHPASAFHVSDPLPLRKAVHVLQIANQLAKYCYPYCDQMQIEKLPDETFALVGLEPSIMKLLNSRMKQTIGRAIFFADSNNDQQKAATPRRFLRPLTGAQAVACVNAAGEPSTRVAVDDDGVAKMFRGSPCEVGEITVAKAIDQDGLHLICHPWEANIDKCVVLAKKVLTGANVSDESRSAASIAISSLLPNLAALCSDQETIELSVQMDRKISLALRTPALAASRRAGKDVSPASACRLAEADVVHALNLDWIDKVIISSSGDAMVCVIS
jgi:putative nucleotidyltransferase with HDIG domain